MTTSEAECLRALRRAAGRIGESPTKAEYEALGLTPASATIIRTLGGWNAATERAGLETYASTGSRTGPKPEDVTLPDGLSWEDLSVDQRWHYRNVEQNTQRTLQRRQRLRAWVNERKASKTCRSCGEDDPACLDYHHRTGEEKTMAITRMITHGFGRDALREEMERCEVLCASCHRKRHARSTGSDGGALRAWVRQSKVERGGCRRCEETDPTSLDFHHEGDEKVGTIADMVSDGRPRTAIGEEIEDCAVLCANCHRKELFEAPDVE